MIKISVREFTHHLSEYLQRAEKGEKIIITKRNKPTAQLSHFNENVSHPSWKESFQPIKIKGEPLSTTVIKMRQEK